MRLIPSSVSSALSRSWGRLRRPLIAAGLTVLAIATVLGGTLLILRSLRSGLLPRMQVAGIATEGMSEQDLKRALAELESARRESSLSLVRPALGESSAAQVEATGAELGYEMDIDATIAAAVARGRQGNPIAALGDHLRAFVSDVEVAAVHRFNGSTLVRWNADVGSKELGDPPFPGGVRFDDLIASARSPEPGVGIRLDDLRAGVLEAFAAGNDAVELTGVPVAPKTTDADVAELVEVARLAVDGRVTLVAEEAEIVIEPEDIAAMFRARAVTEDGSSSLAPAISAKKLLALVGDRAGALSTPPVDASFKAAGESVEVVPSRPGFRFSAPIAARQLIRAAVRKGEASAELRGEKVPAGFSTADAEDLGITEQVSTFTTNHDCCEPRVDNIHRIADLVNGAVVEPGETFSLNEFVGPRTAEKGFVAAPSIRDGEFVAEIGGGISQFATTFFNAVFFGGYEFLEYQAHSYYISRYPQGREATISTPRPDLAFRNDSDAGVYIQATYSATSITVTFYGSTNIEVEAIGGSPYNAKDPDTECQRNGDLKKGEEVLISSGRGGFDIVVTRRITHPGGRTEDEDFFTRYQSEPRIVERKTCPKKKGADT